MSKLITILSDTHVERMRETTNTYDVHIHVRKTGTIIIHALARVGTGLHCTDLVSAHCPALEDWK